VIVPILGTAETVEIPDEPHPVSLELEAFDTLVRKRLQLARSVPLRPADEASAR
jgi:hypothetical protein